MKKIKEIFGKFPVPAMLMAMFTVLYCETLMHLWITEELSAGRFAAVLAFALGFGGILAQIVSFIGHKKWGKWVTFVLLFLVVTVYQAINTVIFTLHGGSEGAPLLTVEPLGFGLAAMGADMLCVTIRNTLKKIVADAKKAA